MSDNLLSLFGNPLERIFAEEDEDNKSFHGTPPFLPPPEGGASVDDPKATIYQSTPAKPDSLVFKPPPQLIFREYTGHTLPIHKIDVTFAQKLDKNAGFSLFHPKHKEIAAKLTQILIDASDLQAAAKYVQKRVNVFLFQYAFSAALHHRSDTKHMTLPSIVESCPDHFIDPSVFPQAREELELFDQENRINITVPFNFSASYKDVEHRMAYFREDIGVNSYYWNWHIMYPRDGHDSIVGKDRRGELFYYMHNQIVNRYNVDRMCNGLELVRPLNSVRVALTEGYFPKLVRNFDNRAFPARVANTFLVDINRLDDDTVAELADIERWRDRIYTAMDQGYVVDEKGHQKSLLGPEGIDILGNVIEGNSLSPNRQFYGSLHDQGQLVISLVHDPDQKYLEDFGVMGYVQTAMRDPIFYRWHSFIDSMFARHKKNLDPYVPEREFQYKGVTVTSIEVQTKRIKKNPKPATNILSTYWLESDVNLKNGVDWAKPKTSVYGRFTHLQHDPFDFTIMVENDNNERRIGTCRIFICPKNDERGAALTFEEQRKLMIEMDKFKVFLHPGTNMIRQQSKDSSVTVPSRLFRTRESPIDDADAKAEKSCFGEWPQHMLLPKGSSMGTKFNIFVMITNYDLDRVHQPDSMNGRNGAASFCELKDRKYPDKRPMGFPFDRPYKVDKLIDFKNLVSNMALGECEIRFDEIQNKS